MSSREGLFQFFQLKAGKGCSIAALFSLLRVLVIQIDVAVVGHRAVTAELCHSGSVVVGRSTIVRYFLQLCFLRDAHAGLLELVQSIDVENFLSLKFEST